MVNRSLAFLVSFEESFENHPIHRSPQLEVQKWQAQLGHGIFEDVVQTVCDGPPGDFVVQWSHQHTWAIGWTRKTNKQTKLSETLNPAETS